MIFLRIEQSKSTKRRVIRKKSPSSMAFMRLMRKEPTSHPGPYPKTYRPSRDRDYKLEVSRPSIRFIVLVLVLVLEAIMTETVFDFDRHSLDSRAFRVGLWRDYPPFQSGAIGLVPLGSSGIQASRPCTEVRTRLGYAESFPRAVRQV